MLAFVRNLKTIIFNLAIKIIIKFQINICIRINNKNYITINSRN